MKFAELILIFYYIKRGRLMPIYILLLFSILSACEEKIHWDIETEQVNTIVVDAIITNEVKYQHIHLTKPFTDQNDTAVPVTGAFVSIVTDNFTVLFFESPDNPGYYFSEYPASGSIDINYELNIQYEEKVYTAETYMIPVLPANLPGWQYNADKDLYQIQWNVSQYNPNEQAIYEVIISWSHMVDTSITDTITMARMLNYTLNTLNVNYNIFPQDKEEVWFPKNSIALVKKYSVTDEYGDFLRALLAETEWQGSIFEEARGNLPGNISNGGLGYFSACSVISDTLIVQ
jgi:hypothetical protein